MNTDLTDLDKLISEGDLAKYWGMTLETFRRNIRYAGAPHYRLSLRTVLYHRQELYDWLKTKKRVGDLRGTTET